MAGCFSCPLCRVQQVPEIERRITSLEAEASKLDAEGALVRYFDPCLAPSLLIQMVMRAAQNQHLVCTVVVMLMEYWYVTQTLFWLLHCFSVWSCALHRASNWFTPLW